MTQKVTLRMDKEGIHTADGRHLEELNPKELFLYAIADCAAHTIVVMLKEHISEVSALEITIEGKLTTPTLVAESRFAHINISYHAECRKLKDQVIVSRAINITHDKYCGLIQMIQRVAPISHDISIVTTEEVA